jgi:hypothetical protein
MPTPLSLLSKPISNESNKTLDIPSFLLYTIFIETQITRRFEMTNLRDYGQGTEYYVYHTLKACGIAERDHADYLEEMRAAGECVDGCIERLCQLNPEDLRRAILDL